MRSYSPGSSSSREACRDDALFVGSDQAHGARLDCLGTFRLVAHDQNGLPERGAFLLDAAGIGEQNVRAAHQVDERHVSQRLDQQDVLQPRQSRCWTGSCTLGLGCTG